ncbi:MAG: PilC/PilY family type IV pilus protein [Proteobacteria bacterium]|nr:PilC/PilY family type IV pilus protein [Pseudomonadota bacterium]
MKNLSFSRWLVCVLLPALSFVWGSGVQAQPVKLADAPLATEAKVPPTIVMVADDSGSMASTYPSDTLVNTQYACVEPGPTPTYAQATASYPWLTAAAQVSFPTYSSYYPTYVYSTLANACPNQKCCTMIPTGGFSDGTNYVVQLSEGICQNGQPPMMAAAFNGLAYNPLIDYVPPKRGNASAAQFPIFDNTSGAGHGLWTNVSWQAPSGITAWDQYKGSPMAVNLVTQRCYYTTAQYNALNNDYLRGTSSGWQSQVGFAASGANAYSVPVHYYRTNVKWCKTTRASTAFNNFANPGTINSPAGGGAVTMTNCQDSYDQTAGYIYPYYYSPSGVNDATKANNQTTPAFDLVVLNLSTPSAPKINMVQNGVVSTGLTSISHPYFDAATGTMKTITRTAAQEVTNYANWAAYYRNRVAATKTSASIAFVDAIPDGAGGTGCNPTSPKLFPRVGFMSISPYGSYPLGQAKGFTVYDFCGSSNRENFTSKLLAYTSYSDTPLREAFNDVGNRFYTDNNNTLVKYACQRSNVILFTDGMWNGTSLGTTTNYDGATLTAKLPDLDLASPPTPAAGTPVYSAYGGGPLPAVGGRWPDPIRDYKNTGPTNTTLADLALQYWMTPLGGASVDNSESAPKPYIKNTRKVASTARDPATWPHLNFYGMGFGVRGTLPLSDQAATLSQMGSGTSPQIYAWPTPAPSGPTAVDDLWHATVNGFGSFVAAQSTEEFSVGLKKILTEILNTGGARSGVALPSPVISSGGYTYSPSFEAGWTGDIIRRSINSSGVESAIPGQKSAAGNLADLLTPTVAIPEPWKTARQVFTTNWNGNKVSMANVDTFTATPFTATGLSTAMLANLGSTSTQQVNVVAYLRGRRSAEGDAIGQFRMRGPGPLGDIVNAGPVVVTTPYCETGPCDYNETDNPGYQAFYNKYQNRNTMVYAAANDGMLHAFDEKLNEKWAYIPSDILYRSQADAGIVNLTFQESDLITPFTHYFYVDATPRAADVFFNTNDSWETMLVGGLGKGGTSYYALRVTDAGALANEAATASDKVRWEFTHNNMGYTYGRAILTKTKADDWGYDSGDSTKARWMAILPSGYNNGSGSGQPKNGDGKGHLFFVDAETGELMNNGSSGDVVTPEGSQSMPLGLVAIGSYTEDYTNQLATTVYGGDQVGNFWRFNLESTHRSDWVKQNDPVVGGVQKMATLKDSTGNNQWVTTEPWPQLDSSATPNRWVFVGTGGFRNENDLLSKTGHTFYAFRDGGQTTTDKNIVNRDARSSASSCGTSGAGPCGLEPVTGTYLTYANGTPPPARQTDNGWYEDLPTSTKPTEGSYHITVNPIEAFGVVVYVANKYTGGLVAGTGSGAGVDPCTDAAFSGKIYARDFVTGASVLRNSGGALVANIDVDGGIADAVILDTGKTDASGNHEYAIGVTSMASKRLILAGFFQVERGSANRAPIRTNIRYININQ